MGASTAWASSEWKSERGEASLSDVYRTISVAHSGPSWRKAAAFVGPGYLVAVGYMDPGNWATSLAGGSKFGYALLVVALVSNIIAIVLQSLCARLAIASGRDLAQACRDAFPKPVANGLWVVAEIAIIATDIAEVIGTAPVERVDVLQGTAVVHSVRPFSAGDLGRRVRVLWQGAEYRGRGRETIWQGKLTVTGNRIARFAAVNFLNPERKIAEVTPGAALGWTSVTTGNLAGVDLWLDRNITRIVEYNQLDTINTYLVWLRMVHFAGRIAEDVYAAEHEIFREFLEAETLKPEKAFLNQFLEKWEM